jgi:hypothetical protein
MAMNCSAQILAEPEKFTASATEIKLSWAGQEPSLSLARLGVGFVGKYQLFG